MPYSIEFITDLDRTLSRARLARYMTAAAGDIDQALQLYEKNLALSEVLFGVLHGLEIAARNSIHHVMSAATTREDWYRNGLLLPWRAMNQLSFTGSMSGMIDDARSKAGRNAPIGKVIAELNFGFWPGMLSRHFKPLWDPCLHRRFRTSRSRAASFTGGLILFAAFVIASLTMSAS